MTQLIVLSLNMNMYFVLSRTAGKKHKNNPTVSVSLLDTYILSTLSFAYWWVKKDWKEKKLLICPNFLFPSVIPVPISYSVTNLKYYIFLLCISPNSHVCWRILVHGAQQMLCANGLTQNFRYIQCSYLRCSCTGSTAPLDFTYKIQSTILRISRWRQHSIKPSVGCFSVPGPVQQGVLQSHEESPEYELGCDIGRRKCTSKSNI